MINLGECSLAFSPHKGKWEENEKKKLKSSLNFRSSFFYVIALKTQYSAIVIIFSSIIIIKKATSDVHVYEAHHWMKTILLICVMHDTLFFFFSFFLLLLNGSAVGNATSTYCSAVLLYRPRATHLHTQLFLEPSFLYKLKLIMCAALVHFEREKNLQFSFYVPCSPDIDLELMNEWNTTRRDLLPPICVCLCVCMCQHAPTQIVGGNEIWISKVKIIIRTHARWTVCHM